MKSEKNILIAFILNLSFSLFEFIGGGITGSVAILSDAVHDIGDSLSIGISYFLEKKSKRKPDESHPFGYGRYSVIGGAVTTLILLLGSIMVTANAIKRIFNPVAINYNGMIAFAVIGVLINSGAVYFTHKGDSLNQKAVSLHMLEDALGWIVVLVGAIVMRFTDFRLIDAIMSVGIAVFIFIHCIENMKEILDILLEKTPRGTDINEIRKQLSAIDGISDIPVIRIWSIDGKTSCALIHAETIAESEKAKETIREKLKEYNIFYTIIETKTED